MSDPAEISALLQQEAQLQQVVHDLEGHPDAVDKLVAVRAQLADTRIALNMCDETGAQAPSTPSQAVQIIQEGGVNFGIAPSIGTIKNLVAGNQTIITEDVAYSVAGLENPYLGLRAFTADERDIFAGRERLVQALVARLAAKDGDRLLFLVGASGSGKSSLAKAGVLPALETRMLEMGLAVEKHFLDCFARDLVSTLEHLIEKSSKTRTNKVPAEAFEKRTREGGGLEKLSEAGGKIR